MKTKLSVLFLLLPVLLFSQYQQAGTDSTIDVLCWNIEWFAKNDQSTIDEVAKIVSEVDGDLIAVEEIASVDEFNQLVSQLSGWNGILTPHTYSDGSYQKVGLLYNSSKVTIHSYKLLFENDSYTFPRPPMEFTVTVNEGSKEFDFKLIVVHLKAYGDETSESRRRAAIQDLKTYVDSEMLKGGEQDFILCGDFNDHLEDPSTDNVFQVMLNDSQNYTFLTQAIVGSQGSYIGFNEPNLIDHICVTNDALTEYGQAGKTQVLYLDNQNSSYENLVSDHRPVLAQFAYSNNSISDTTVTPVAEIHSNFNHYLGQIVTVKGIVTVSAGVFSPFYTSAYVQDSSGAGINIYYASAVISDMQQGQSVEVTGEVSVYNGLHELLYSNHTKLADHQSLPDTMSISTNVINNMDAGPGSWVQITGTIESISDGPHINMMVNDGSGSGKVYFDPDAGLDVSDFLTGDSITLIGVKTVYDNEGQMQPAYQSDIKKTVASSIRSEAAHPRNFSLYQNYPNPFNPRTVITYQLGTSDRITLIIYNALGQKIFTLFDQYQGAGIYSLPFDGSGLSSGVYYYRIQSSSFDKVKKMILIR